jgi:hypothetical protein
VQHLVTYKLTILLANQTLPVGARNTAVSVLYFAVDSKTKALVKRNLVPAVATVLLQLMSQSTDLGSDADDDPEDSNTIGARGFWRFCPRKHYIFIYPLYAQTCATITTHPPARIY